MKKFLSIIIICSGIFCHAFGQKIKLTAMYDAGNATVKLNWNMVNSSLKTGYLLLRSSDGITWAEAAKDKSLRNYTAEDNYFFNDRLFFAGKNFYRVRIADGNNNSIALSPIVTVITPGPVRATTSPANTQKQTTVKESTVPKSNNSWVIYPNPASDVLTLTYKGLEELKGVVNVQIQDARGKTVIRFRSGSLYKTIQIPISNLQRGTYVIQLSVLNEFMMNQGFIKQ